VKGTTDNLKKKNMQETSLYLQMVVTPFSPKQRWGLCHSN